MEKTFDLQAYTAQASRVIDKLNSVRTAPPKHEVFGSSSHKYRLFPVETEANLAALEEKENFVFPDALKAFFLLIGSGPNKRGSHLQGGAGPFYGIAAASICYAMFDQNRSTCHFYPGMGQAAWEEKIEQFDSDADLFTGMLAFGTQGCSFDNAIVLDGEFAGRVVYIDHERGMTPIFCSDANFLDWYERWLDEILAGYDLHSFGEWPTGHQPELRTSLEQAIESSDDAAALRALNGFHKFRVLDEQSRDLLRTLQRSDNGPVRALALHFLLKFDANASTAFAVRELSSGGEARHETLSSLQQNNVELNSTIESAVREILESSDSAMEVTRAYSILKEANVALGDTMLRLTRHEDLELRRLGFARLGDAPDKARFRNILVSALDDTDVRVSHAAVQSLKGLEGIDLLASLSKLARKHPTNEHYILTNILHRLEQIGPESQALVTELASSSDDRTATEAYRMLVRWGVPNKRMPKPGEYVFGGSLGPKPKKSMLARLYEWVLS